MFWCVLPAVGGFVHEKGLLPQTCRYCLEIVFHSNGFHLVMLTLLVVPAWLSDLTGTICEDLGLYPSPINHVLINEYLPGQGIMVHFPSCLIWSVWCARFKILLSHLALFSCLCCKNCSRIKMVRLISKSYRSYLSDLQPWCASLRTNSCEISQIQPVYNNSTRRCRLFWCLEVCSCSKTVHIKVSSLLLFFLFFIGSTEKTFPSKVFWIICICALWIQAKYSRIFSKISMAVSCIHGWVCVCACVLQTTVKFC
jgi:hypothetical protein